MNFAGYKHTVNGTISSNFTSIDCAVQSAHLCRQLRIERMQTYALGACRSGCRAPLLSGPWPKNNSIAPPFWRRLFLIGAISVCFSRERGREGEASASAIGCCLCCVVTNMFAGLHSSPCVFRLHQYSSNLFTILYYVSLCWN